MWQQNLLSNLLTIGILFSLAVIVYCKIKNVTLIELIKSLREATTDE